MKLRCAAINKYHGRTYASPSLNTLDDTFRGVLKDKGLDPDLFTAVQIVPVLWKNITHVAWYVFFIESRYLNCPGGKETTKD